MIRIRLAVLIFLILGEGSRAIAAAGPPLITDDPGTVEDKHWEINLAFTTTINKDGSTLDTPLLDANYGLGERTQLRYQVPWVIQTTPGLPAQSGLGDTNLGVKRRFLDKEKTGVSVSTYPGFIFRGFGGKNINTDTKDLAHKSFFLPIEAEENVGAFELNQEIGYTFIWQDSPQWAYGLVASRQIREGLILQLELRGTAQTNFSDHEVLLNAGAVFDFSKVCSLLLALGETVHPYDNDPHTFLSYLGMQFHI